MPLIRVESAACAGGRTQVSLRQGQFSRDDPRRAAARLARAGHRLGRRHASCAPWSKAAPARRPCPGCGPLVVNYGQAGYYRTLYAPALLARLTRNYARLRPLDQIGLLADNWALGPRRLPDRRPPRSTWSTRRPPMPIAALLIRVATILAQINEHV